ncbi:DNA-3-methyladenine glycosylase 1 [Rubripirellula lacrimiformis]|uniref:DNA-3-methyladenine glycosylase I n=1 Tax=Rubripirellula lacrimiformis TaxID=1930273 RepID=A0A517N3C7_9BACT|nr:DNA-3-methyladenine glycosylase I [Rubripirellula lacrimiformis]QDT01639.1 DNA-3-methyladenine glycosylase 1 [Rubripirellula lacrimiformis]
MAKPTPTKPADLIVDPQRVGRCWWCGDDPLYVEYHDQQWGRPLDDDQRLFEKVCLEGFQAGLSWITILRKRESFRQGFADFDFHQVALFDTSDVDRLVADASIVRHRGKIESTINNAKRAIEMLDEFGSLAKYFWSFEPPSQRSPRSRDEVAAKTEESTRLSKSLKKRGWSFVGPTTCYAFMQATGMVNDHLQSCHQWQSIQEARKTFTRP